MDFPDADDDRDELFDAAPWDREWERPVVDPGEVFGFSTAERTDSIPGFDSSGFLEGSGSWLEGGGGDRNGGSGVPDTAGWTDRYGGR